MTQKSAGKAKNNKINKAASNKKDGKMPMEVELLFDMCAALICSVQHNRVPREKVSQMIVLLSALVYISEKPEEATKQRLREGLEKLWGITREEPLTNEFKAPKATVLDFK